MLIHGKRDYVRIEHGRIHCCNFKKGDERDGANPLPHD